ncbi:hypothetical protein CC2G_002730 [Coprinopsis cinerea AmutBmut pab1-1]|nr:hypothetical protein CC2G_002730 [Coprinopsis cinerea AmutBmut pab1-1]
MNFSVNQATYTGFGAFGSPSIFLRFSGISTRPTRYSSTSREYRPDPLDIPPLLRNIVPTHSIFLHLWGISPLDPTRYSPSSPLYRPSWHPVDIPPLPRNIASRPLDILPVRHYIDPLGTRSIFLHFLGISPQPTRYSPSSPLYRPSWHSVDIPPLPRNIAPTHSIFLHLWGISPLDHSIFSQFATISTLLAPDRYSSTS